MPDSPENFEPEQPGPDPMFSKTLKETEGMDYLRAQKKERIKRPFFDF